MSNESLFDGVDEATQAEYEKEAAERWDPELVRRSNQQWKSYSPAQQKQIIQQSEQVYRDWAEAMPHGEASPEVQTLVAQWHQNLRFFYEPNQTMLQGLGEMYVVDPRFAEKFRTLHPDFPEFMQRSIAVYCAKLLD